MPEAFGDRRGWARTAHEFEDAKEAVGSMGDDAPLAVISSQARTLSHFFRQNFSQVTNPPIDSLREGRVMSLKTRFGNLRNVLDENNSQTEILVLESPFVATTEFGVMVERFGDQVAFIDCTFPVGEGLDDLDAFSAAAFCGRLLGFGDFAGYLDRVQRAGHEATEIAARIVEKVRVNPGNYADKKKFDVREYSDVQYQEELERIRERYPLRFHLSSRHLGDLISGRLIRHKAGAEAQIDKLWNDLNRLYPDLLPREHFQRIYPVHPFTLELLEQLTPLFSRQRNQQAHDRPAARPRGSRIRTRCRRGLGLYAKALSHLCLLLRRLSLGKAVHLIADISLLDRTHADAAIK